MNKKQLVLDLIDQIIALAQAKDREFIKLTEKFNTNAIYEKKVIPNGEDAIVHHLQVLKELLQEEIKEECSCKSTREKAESTMSNAY